MWDNGVRQVGNFFRGGKKVRREALCGYQRIAGGASSGLPKAEGGGISVPAWPGRVDSGLLLTQVK